MSIPIVSTNPLFKEVTAATIVQFQTELIEFSPGEALTRICELGPDDLIEAIASFEHEIHSKIDNCKIADAGEAGKT